MSWLYIAIAVLSCAVIVLLYRYIRLKSEIRKISGQLEELVSDNSEKMLDAGLKQAEAIRRISLKQGLFTLPPALREIARLRVENPDLSLQELGEMMDPPVGKSGVNHRLRRLMEIARQVELEYGEGGKEG